MAVTKHQNKGYKYREGGIVKPADDEDAPDLTNMSKVVGDGVLGKIWDAIPSPLGRAVTGKTFTSDDEINETNRKRVRDAKERDKSVPSRRDR